MIICVCVCVQFLHKLTARALIQDFEDGNLDSDEVEHEVCACACAVQNKTKVGALIPNFSHCLGFSQGKKAELKHFIIELSKEYSILSQFTSFVAIEERVCGALFFFLVWSNILGNIGYYWEYRVTTEVHPKCPFGPPANLHFIKGGSGDVFQST